MNCPFCNNKMRKLPYAVPPFLDPTKKAVEHPFPILRRWVGYQVRRTVEDIEENVTTYICERCGFIGLFDKKIESSYFHKDSSSSS